MGSNLTRLFGNGLDALWEGDDTPTPLMTDILRERLAQEKQAREQEQIVQQNQPSFSSVYENGLGNFAESAKNAFFPERSEADKADTQQFLEQESDPWVKQDSHAAGQSILQTMGGNVKHVLDTGVGMASDTGALGQLVDQSQQGNESGQALFNVAQNVLGGRMSPAAMTQKPFLKEFADETKGRGGYAGVTNALLRGGQTAGEDIGGMALDPNSLNPSRTIQSLQSGGMIRGAFEGIGDLYQHPERISPESIAHLLPLILGSAHFGSKALEGRAGEGNALQSEKGVSEPARGVTSESPQQLIPDSPRVPQNVIDIPGLQSTTPKETVNSLPGLPEIPPGADLSGMQLEAFHPEQNIGDLVNIDNLHNPEGMLNAGFDFNEIPRENKVKNLGPIPGEGRELTTKELLERRETPEQLKARMDKWAEANKSDLNAIEDTGAFRERMFGVENKNANAKALENLTRNPSVKYALADLAEKHGTSNLKKLGLPGYFHEVFQGDNPDVIVRASNQPYAVGDKAVEWPDSKYVIKPKETKFVGGKQIDIVPKIKKIVEPSAEQVRVLNEELAKEGKYTLADPEGSGGNLTVIGGKARVVDPGALVPIEVAKKYEASKGVNSPEATKARREMNNYIRRAGFDFDEGKALEEWKANGSKPDEHPFLSSKQVVDDEHIQSMIEERDILKDPIKREELGWTEKDAIRRVGKLDELIANQSTRKAGFDLEDLDPIPGYKSNADEVMKDLVERGIAEPKQKLPAFGSQTAKQKRQLRGESTPIKVDELFDPETGELLNDKLPDFPPQPKTQAELIQESLGKIRAEKENKTPVSTPKASGVLDNDLTTESGSGREKGRPPGNRQFGNKPPGGGDGKKPPNVSPAKLPGGEENPANPQKTTEKSLFDVVTDLPKELKSSMDISFPFRQGLFLLNRPAALKGMGRGLKNLVSEKGHLETKEYLGSKWTNRERAKEAGLAQIEYDPTVKTSTSEEFGWQGLGKLPGFKHTERSFIDSGNLVRANMFDEFTKGRKPDPEFDKGVADYLNTLTGRTPLPKKLAKLSNVANKALWSPRFVASRVQLLNPAFYSKLPRDIQKAALRDVAGTLGAVALVTGGIKAVGDATGEDTEIGVNPLKGNFGYVRTGKTSYNLFAGLTPLVKLYSRLATGRTEEKKGTKRLEGFSPGSALGFNEELEPASFGHSTIGEVGRFARGKESPAVGAIHNLGEGKDYLGQKFDASDLPEYLASPLAIQDFIQAYKTGGLTEALKTLPGLAGVGVQVQKDLAEDKEKPVKKVAPVKKEEKKKSTGKAYSSLFN